MTFEQKPGQGSLFVKKDRTGQQPNMTGNIVAHRDIKAGETLRLAAWTKTPKAGGDKFLSLNMSDPMSSGDNAPQSSAPLPEAAPQNNGGFAEDGLDDEIPF